MYRYEFTVDKELKILCTDRAFEKITGNTSAEILGCPYFKFIPQIKIDDQDALEHAMLRESTLQLNDYQATCICGISKANIIIEPIIDLALIVTGAHVTVESYPECPLTKQIKQSNKLVDIGKASAGLAHGVRSPLNSIKGAIIYLQGKYNADPTFFEFSKLIEDEINKLDKFITNFLSRSKSESKTTDIDLNVLLEKIVKIVKMHADSKNIFISTSYGQTPTIRGDYFQIKHAILNIINNSIDAINSSGTINIKTYASILDNRNHVVVEISDTGCGFIDASLLPSLKDESIEKGRGFGLFITYEIVKNLGGCLEITSEKMVGTTVKIIIPVGMS